MIAQVGFSRLTFSSAPFWSAGIDVDLDDGPALRLDREREPQVPSSVAPTASEDAQQEQKHVDEVEVESESTDKGQIRRGLTTPKQLL